MMAAQASAETTTRWPERDGGRIAYDDSGGTGPLVVAVPGLGDLRGEYRFLAPRLAAAGYRVATMDVRGHGESSAGWADHAASAVGADSLALVERLGAGPAVIAGTSMAGGAAAWAAAERPDLVAGVIPVNPFTRDIPPALTQRLMLGALPRRPWGPAAWSHYYRSLYPTSSPADLDAYRAALTANLRQPGRFEAAVAMVWSSKADVEARLGQVRCPALVLMGTKDPDFPDPLAEGRLVAGRLGGELAAIEGAGHYPQAEMPERPAAVALEFLGRTLPAGGRPGERQG